jgi:hypothetical protein
MARFFRALLNKSVYYLAWTSHTCIQGTLLQLDRCADEHTETTTVARQKINDKFKPLLWLALSGKTNPQVQEVNHTAAVQLSWQIVVQ